MNASGDVSNLRQRFVAWPQGGRDGAHSHSVTAEYGRIRCRGCKGGAGTEDLHTLITDAHQLKPAKDHGWRVEAWLRVIGYVRYDKMEESKDLIFF